MDDLFVWVYLPGQLTPVLCGVLSMQSNRRSTSFSYTNSYLSDNSSFALSPSLPLQKGSFAPSDGYFLNEIFSDAGPDQWGKTVINRTINPQRRSEIDYLWYSSEIRIGSLGFSSSDKEYIVYEQSFPNSAIDLVELLDAAARIERHLPVSEHLKRFLKPGTSLGGMRPKGLVLFNEKEWIAKFPSCLDENYGATENEYAAMRLAQKAGIRTAECQLINVGKEKVLLVSRFDRQADGSRIHFASAKTLLACLPEPVMEGSYPSLAEAIRLFSGKRVSEQTRELFRRMVFNIAIDNTDDHEKNHGFIWANGAPVLSPAYDISPQYSGLGYQGMVVGAKGSGSDFENALSQCGKFGLSGEQAREIIREVRDVVADWKIVFLESGVLDHDIESLQHFFGKCAI